MIGQYLAFGFLRSSLWAPNRHAHKRFSFLYIYLFISTGHCANVFLSLTESPCSSSSFLSLSHSAKLSVLSKCSFFIPTHLFSNTPLPFISLLLRITVKIAANTMHTYEVPAMYKVVLNISSVEVLYFIGKKTRVSVKYLYGLTLTSTQRQNHWELDLNIQRTAKIQLEGMITVCVFRMGETRDERVREMECCAPGGALLNRFVTLGQWG